MTTLATVTNELKHNNFPTTGCYEKIPQLTYSLVINILHFGENEINKSTLGKGIKEIALKLAKADGRKPSICPNTCKTVLA